MRLNYACVIFYILNIINVASTYAGVWRSDIACDILESFSAIWYHFAKGCMYTIFVNRLYIVFYNSIFGYSFKSVYFPLYTFIISFWIFAVIGDLLFIRGRYNKDTIDCDADFALWGVALQLFIDLILSTIFLVLFIKPLCKLAFIEQASAVDDDKITKLIKKNCILVCTAIISSFITVGFFVMVDANTVLLDRTSFTLVNIDAVVNSVCLLLMNASMDKLYNKLCFCYGCKCCDFGARVNAVKPDANGRTIAKMTADKSNIGSASPTSKESASIAIDSNDDLGHSMRDATSG